MFDIDKLFIAFKHYHVVNGKLTDQFNNQHSSKYQVNRLLDHYLALLKDERSLDKLYGPIDNDTQYFKDIVAELEEDVIIDPAVPYESDMLYYQCSVRDEFINGKTGIGPFALNNNNHILTMLYGISFNNVEDTLLGKLGHIRLDKATDDEGLSILSKISGLINAHVDVAKDPYISRLNINSCTYNLTNLLVRTGFGKQAIYFLTQPILKLIAQSHINAGGVYMIEPGVSKYKAQKNAVENTFLEFWNTMQSQEDSFKKCYNKAITYIQNKYGVKYHELLYELFRPESTVFRDIAKMHSLDNMQTKFNDYVDVGNSSMSLWDVQLLAAIAYFEFQPQAQDLADLVKYSKIDTKKQGSNVIAQQAFLNGYRNIFEPYGKDNLFRLGNTNGEQQIFSQYDSAKFVNGARMARESYIGVKTNNATQLLRRILKDHMPSATSKFMSIVDYVLSVIHQPISTNEDLLKDISNSIISILKSKYFFGENGYCSRFNIDPKQLIYGDNTIYDRLLKIQVDIQSGKYPELIDANGNISNYLLSTLTSSTIDETTGAKFIDTLNMIDDAVIDENDMRDGWTQLLEDSAHPELQEFARDLIVYAFMTSFDSGFKNIFAYVPQIWRNRQGHKDGSYVQYCESIMDRLSDLSNLDSVPFDQSDLNMLFLMNTSNDYMVPIITESIGNTQVMIPLSKKDGVPSVYAAITKKNKKGIVTYTVNEKFSSESAPQFFKSPVAVDGNGNVTYAYYKLTDYGMIGNAVFPIYSRVQPVVHKTSGGFRVYDVNAKNIESQVTKSIEFLQRSVQQLEKIIESNNDKRLMQVVQEGVGDIDFIDYGELIITSTIKRLQSTDQSGTAPEDNSAQQEVSNNDPQRFASAKESEQTINSKKTILSNEELKYWNENGVDDMPRILVASERTDPAFHVNEILDILNGNKSVDQWGVVNGRRQVIGHLSGKDFAGLYLITKHDGIPMQKLLEAKIPKLIHFSITGLGGTKYEPGVMKPDDLLDRIKEYIDMGLDPKSITIRIDPIIPGVTTPKMIENIIKRSSEMGISRIRFSIMDAYSNTVVALEKVGYDFKTNYGINQVSGRYNFNAKTEKIDAIVEFMLQMADKYNITLGTCAENIAKRGISKEGCLSVDAVNKMLGTSIEDKGVDNNDQRKLCSCYGGKIDALAYGKNCASHCIYCYAKHENDIAMQYYNEDGTLKDNQFTRTNSTFVTLSTQQSPLQIYSDGSDIKGTGSIGYGAVFEHNGEQYGISGTESGEEVAKLKELFPDTKFSNPTMEMLALTTVLEHFANSGKAEHIEINQDYKGAVNYDGLWQHSEGSNQRAEKPWNAKEQYIAHLVERAKNAIDKIESSGGSVKIRWVKGHQTGQSYEARMNDAADRYAKNRDNFNNINNAYNQQSSSNQQQDSKIVQLEFDFMSESSNSKEHENC